VKVPLDSPKFSLKTRQRLAIATILDFINSDGSELVAWVPSLPALIEVDPKLDGLLVNSTPFWLRTLNFKQMEFLRVDGKVWAPRAPNL
jgi:hypothetical protein